MKQASLKLKMYAGNVNEVVHSDLRQKLVRGIFAYMGILASFYLLFLGSMVMDIIERKALEAEAREIANEVGQLELTYLDLSGSIDLSFAAERGFKEAQAKFATRKALGSIQGSSANTRNRNLINNEI